MTSWHADAACRGCDPSLFFPGRGDNQSVQRAQAVCAACPVQDDCLTHHLPEKYGVWGGTSERQRRRIRYQHRIDRQRATTATAPANHRKEAIPA